MCNVENNNKNLIMKSQLNIIYINLAHFIV